MPCRGAIEPADTKSILQSKKKNLQNVNRTKDERMPISPYSLFPLSTETLLQNIYLCQLAKQAMAGRTKRVFFFAALVLPTLAAAIVARSANGSPCHSE